MIVELQEHPTKLFDVVWVDGEAVGYYYPESKRYTAIAHQSEPQRAAISDHIRKTGRVVDEVLQVPIISKERLAGLEDDDDDDL